MHALQFELEGLRRRVALTSVVAARVAVRAGVHLFGVSVAVVCGAIATGSIVAPIIQEALLHAAHLPALQALACFLLLAAPLVAALTWPAVGWCTAVEIVPVMTAGEHGATACRCVDKVNLEAQSQPQPQPMHAFRIVAVGYPSRLQTAAVLLALQAATAQESSPLCCSGGLRLFSYHHEEACRGRQPSRHAWSGQPDGHSWSGQPSGHAWSGQPSGHARSGQPSGHWYC